MKNCSECGASVPDEAGVCDLCGSPVEPSKKLDPVLSDSKKGPSLREAGSTSDSGGEGGNVAVFCNQCGHENPANSRFCSSCGSKLETLPVSESISSSGGQGAVVEAEVGNVKPAGESAGDKASASEKATGRQISIVVGAGALIVLALYLISYLSSSPDRPASSVAVSNEAPVSGPLTGPYTSEAEKLLGEIEDLSGDDRIDKQWELVDLYRSASRLDLAAVEAEKIASIVQTERSWIDTGNLYFDWMDRLDTPFKGPYAARAIDAYEKALEINPDNLDVRTDMGIALMYDPTRAIRAIQETTKVLEMDSLHVQANFNRGIMLRQISRMDQAVAQFEKVKRIIGDPENPIYQRAEAAIRSIRGDS
jgi:ribosomal protein L40E